MTSEATVTLYFFAMLLRVSPRSTSCTTDVGGFAFSFSGARGGGEVDGLGRGLVRVGVAGAASDGARQAIATITRTARRITRRRRRNGCRTA